MKRSALNTWPVILPLCLLVACLLFAAGYFGLHRKVAEVAEDISLAGLPYFDPEEMDLGIANWGDVISFELYLTNPGDEPQEIADLAMSCSCTALAEDLIGEIIGPGGTKVILVEMDMDDETGRKTRTFDAVFKSGHTTHASAAVVIEPNYELSTSLVDFGPVDILDPAVIGEVVHFRSDIAAISEVSTDCDWLRAHANAAEGGADVLIQVQKDGLRFGKMFGNVIVETTDAIRPNEVVRVQLEGRTQLKPHPTKVFLIGKETQTVRFVDDAGQPVKLESASVSDDRLEIVVLDSRVEVTNTSGTVLQLDRLHVTDDHGRCGVALVHTFPEKG